MVPRSGGVIRPSQRGKLNETGKNDPPCPAAPRACWHSVIVLDKAHRTGAPAWDREKKVWKLWDCTTPNDLHTRHLYCGGYYESREVC